MKKLLLVFAVTLVTFVSYGQTTIGVMGSLNVRESFDSNYGGWIDFKKFGIEYLHGAEMSNNSPIPYLNGSVKKYVAGSYYRNFGLHLNSQIENVILSYGGGIQNVTDITTSGLEPNTLPYVSLGVGRKFSNDNYFLKGNLILGKISSIGIGFGIVLR